ncbi:hypothetical protein ACGFX8_15560 [Streptomyces sp. NPDC048362]|uniref:hypothetical protein n=1 Tax=Streptomyces sp. NPDC048362 TaxID=3365539 RepID=UPI003721464B
MLAAAILAVTQARATTQTPGGPLAPSSTRDLLRILRATILRPPHRDLEHLPH